MLKNKTMWVALDERGKIQNAWYRGHTMSFRLWRRVIRKAGWTAVSVELVGEY